MTKPLAAKLAVSLPELQVTFSLLIILQTLCAPLNGKASDVALHWFEATEMAIRVGVVNRMAKLARLQSVRIA